MSSARPSASGSRGIAAVVVIVLALLPNAGGACAPSGAGCSTPGASSTPAQKGGPHATARTNAIPPAAARAVETSCGRGSGVPMCAEDPEAEPTPAEEPVVPSPAASPRTARTPEPSDVQSSGSVVDQPSPEPGRVAPAPRVGRRTIFVPRLIEVVLERPAVAASIAGGLVIGFGLIALFLLVLRRRRREDEFSADESARRAYGSLTESFLNHLSHELYTPLTPVKAYASMLKRVDLPPKELRQVADNMITASGQLERVIEMLVGLADVRRSAPNTRTDVVDVAAVILRAADRVAQPRRRMISIAIDPALPQVRANGRLLELAVWALIDNAIKFSQGRVVIRADLRPRADDRELLRIRVTDRGIGMSADQLRVASDAFRQIDGTLARPFGGLGIGLSLADEVARAHRGRILASSRPGRGSTFTLSIPLIPDAHGIAVEPLSSEQAG